MIFFKTLHLLHERILLRPLPEHLSHVTVEELNLPLKRNQDYVMKYFMQYRTEISKVIEQSSNVLQQLLLGGDSTECDYLIALVDLLATCAEVRAKSWIAHPDYRDLNIF